MNIAPITRLLVLPLLLAAAVACDGEASTTTPGTATAGPDWPADLVTDAAPADAQGVAAAKGTAAEGGTIVIRGRIGGSPDPFVEGRAVMTIADTDAIVDCKAMSANGSMEDGCTTTWDYCCEPQDQIVANTATVQVVDAAGRPLHRSLSDLAGLAPLAVVVVEGTVGPRPSANVLVVNAARIYVETP